MKRDMDLIRAILLYVEEHDDFDTYQDREAFPDHDETVVAEHVQQLKEAGLVDAVVRDSSSGIVAAGIFRLTTAGHDFLDASRNNTLWNRSKAIIAEKGGGATFDAVKALLAKLARDHLLS